MRGRPRGMEQVALDFRTAEDANLLQLLRRLHPFGGDPHTEASRQINGGADDGASLALIPRPKMKLRSILIRWNGKLNRYPSDE